MEVIFCVYEKYEKLLILRDIFKMAIGKPLGPFYCYIFIELGCLDKLKTVTNVEAFSRINFIF